MKKTFFLILLAMLIVSGCQSDNDLTDGEKSEISKSESTTEISLSEGGDVMSETKPNAMEAEETIDYSSLSYTPTESDLRNADEMTAAPLYTGEYDKLPASTELPEGVIPVKLSDGYNSDIDISRVTVYKNVVYDNRDGEELVLQILLPPKSDMDAPSPLIIYIPGSAWGRQNVYMVMPAMTRVAAQGYAVAIVEYRGTDVAFFPAQIEDAKTAVRFMRMNSAEYKINPEKIAVWGDSSGGHTAVMAGITGDSELNNDANSDYSSEVNCIIDWYGPTDITLMSYYPSILDHVSPNSPEGKLIGELNVLENNEIAQKTNPLNYITTGKNIPPILIMHGSRDSLVPFNQSVRLYEKLRQHEKTVQMYKVEDGLHGAGGFAGDEALDLVLDYISKQFV